MIVLSALLTVVVLGAFAFLLSKNASPADRRLFWPALLFKLAAGISLGLIYTFYYDGSDSFVFFKDASTLNRLARTDVFVYINFLWDSAAFPELINQIYSSEPRSLFFVKIVSVVTLIAADNYWLTSLWFSFFSFVACWFLFVKTEEIDKSFRQTAALSFLFIPSFVFWGSGILKECAAVTALCFLLGNAISLYRHKNISVWSWFVTVISAYVLWSLKYYWAAVLFPTLTTTLIFSYLRPDRKRPRLESVYWSLVFFILCLGVTFLHPNFYLERFLEVIVENHNLLAQISDENAMVHFISLDASWKSLVVNSPLALFSGLFRPMIFEASNFFQFVSALENLVWLVLLIFNLKRLRELFSSRHHLLAWSMTVFVVVLCILLTLSTPNFGTLSRYRVGFLPFFGFLVLYKNPLLQRIPFMKSW